MSTLTRADFISAVWRALPLSTFALLGNLLVSVFTHLSFFRPLNLSVAVSIALLLFLYAFILRLFTVRRSRLRYASFLAQHPEFQASLLSHLNILKANLQTEAALLASIRAGLHSLNHPPQS